MAWITSSRLQGQGRWAVKDAKKFFVP